MKKIIKQVLDELKWKYLENEDVIKFDVEGETSSWSSFIKIEGDDLFSYYSVLPAKAEADSLSAMSEFLLRLNYALRVGSFEINLSDSTGRGQIMLKTYGLVPEKPEENSGMAADIVRKAIAYNMLTMDYYAKPLLKAIYSDEKNFDEILRTTERGEQI